MTLTEFLLARIAEDEAQARRSQADMARNPQLNLPVSWVNGVADRVLAECEAKRRIVSLHDEPDGSGTCRSCWDELDSDYAVYPCDTLRDLAAVYADHPDYGQEWTP